MLFGLLFHGLTAPCRIQEINRVEGVGAEEYCGVVGQFFTPLPSFGRNLQPSVQSQPLDQRLAHNTGRANHFVRRSTIECGALFRLQSDADALLLGHVRSLFRNATSHIRARCATFFLRLGGGYARVAIMNLMEAGMAKLHKSITIERVTDAGERRMTTLDNPGFCIACGEEVEGVEPDACGYECELCGEDKVYGADELMLHMVLA
jgi:hypothetical protein